MVVEWTYDVWLVVTGTWLDYDFPYIGNFIIPTDELIFFRGVGIPPTRKSHDASKNVHELETTKLGDGCNHL